MKYINKYKNFSINESVSDNEVDGIIEVLLDMTDNYQFGLESYGGLSQSSPMTYQNYLDKDINYQHFRPIFKAGIYTRSAFELKIPLNSSIGRGYNNYIDLLDEMTTVVGRFKDMEWSMYNMKMNTIQPKDNVGDVIISDVTFWFSKPDIEEEDPSSKPSKSGIKGLLDKIGIDATDIDIVFNGGKPKYQIDVEFQTNEYDGHIPKDIEDRFERFCNSIGASYDYRYGDYKVIFYWG